VGVGMKWLSQVFGKVLCTLGLHKWRYTNSNRDEVGYRECRRCRRFEATDKMRKNSE
jgi:Prophage protein (DUF1660)